MVLCSLDERYCDYAQISSPVPDPSMIAHQTLIHGKFLLSRIHLQVLSPLCKERIQNRRIRLCLRAEVNEIKWVMETSHGDEWEEYVSRCHKEREDLIGVSMGQT